MFLYVKYGSRKTHGSIYIYYILNSLKLFYYHITFSLFTKVNGLFIPYFHRAHITIIKRGGLFTEAQCCFGTSSAIYPASLDHLRQYLLQVVPSILMTNPLHPNSSYNTATLNSIAPSFVAFSSIPQVPSCI